MAIMTIGVAAVELLLKFGSRHTWRDTVLQELEIYRQMEESKTLKDERDVMRALKKSILSTMEDKVGTRTKPMAFPLRIVLNLPMLTASIVIGAVVLIIAAAFGLPWYQLFESVALFTGVVAGVEAVVNLVGLVRGRL